jgi:hypothetical protein
MKDKDKATWVIDIHLTRGLVVVLSLVLVAVATLGTLAWGRGEAAAAAPDAPAGIAVTGQRQFYLTKARYHGGEASGSDGNGAGVCASGYHFASVWEILDPSNLAYNSTLGWDWTEIPVVPDMGQGPPSGSAGWVRTGAPSFGGTGAGEANCQAWTSSNEGVYGSLVGLRLSWSSATGMHVWETYSDQCHLNYPVWCVED